MKDADAITSLDNSGAFPASMLLVIIGK